MRGQFVGRTPVDRNSEPQAKFHPQDNPHSGLAPNEQYMVRRFHPEPLLHPVAQLLQRVAMLVSRLDGRIDHGVKIGSGRIGGVVLANGHPSPWNLLKQRIK